MIFRPQYFAPVSVSAFVMMGHPDKVPLEDGPGWSHRGYFDKAGDFVYWQDGTVTNLADEGVTFTVGNDYRKPEERTRYSLWTEEQRAEVRAKLQAEREEAEMLRNCEDQKRLALLASAKAKLTSEEYDAVFSEGYSEGRDY